MEILNDRAIIAPFSLSPLFKSTNPEHISQFKLVKGLNVKRVNYLFLFKTIPVTLYDILFTFRDADKKFELNGGLLKLITNKTYNVDLANFADNKIMSEIAKEMTSDGKAVGNECTIDKSLIRLLKLLAIVAESLRKKSFSKLIDWKNRLLSSNLTELCDRIKLLLQEKQNGNKSHIVNEEIFARTENLLEYKRLSTMQLSTQCELFSKTMQFFISEMLKLNEKCEVDRRILNIDYISYSPTEVSRMNTTDSQTYINIPWKNCDVSLVNCCFYLNFEYIKTAEECRYANSVDLGIFNLGPVALFSKYKLTTSKGKRLEKFGLTPIVSFMYKIKTSNRGSDDLSVGFDWDHIRKQRELTKNRNIKGKSLVRNLLKEVFEFAEHQEKCKYGLGYEWTLTSKQDGAILNKVEAIADARIKIDNSHWCEPHYTPSIPQQGILSNQYLDKTPTELRYIEKSVFMKEVINQNLWNFAFNSQKFMDIPIWIVVGFRQKDR